jgi:hypothetical protein
MRKKRAIVGIAMKDKKRKSDKIPVILYKAKFDDDTERRYARMMEHCPSCLIEFNNKKIFCPRNADAQCLICGKSFCGAHIGIHLKKRHCVSLDLEHCIKQEKKEKKKSGKKRNRRIEHNEIYATMLPPY